MAQTLQPTISLVGKIGTTTKTVYIATTKVEEDFSNPPIELPISQQSGEMVTKFYNLLKTKNTFTITGKIGYDVDKCVNTASPRNTWQCYCDLRDLAGAEQLDTNSVTAGKAVTMTFFTTATVTDLKFRYPRSGTDKEFTCHIMKAKITHTPEDATTPDGSSIRNYNPDYVAGATGKEANVLDVIVQVLIGEPMG